MEETVKEIPLKGSDKPALVDDEDFERVIGTGRRTWRITALGYVEWMTRKDYKTVHHQMANLIMGSPPKGYIWDHRDRDPLNNQRCNLRLATNSQNGRNSEPRCQSGFKGVYSRKDCTKPWTSKLTYGGRRINLGLFDTKEEAARAYDEAAKTYFGEFAYLNFS